jgi:hypothetical protein
MATIIYFCVNGKGFVFVEKLRTYFNFVNRTMKLKLINKPARQDRGMNIPLGGYLCCAAEGASGFSIWRSLSSDISTSIFFWSREQVREGPVANII